jgi:hypothetical protein
VNVSATVAGYEATWRFRDSRRLDAWLSDQPWRTRGGVLAVRVASSAQVPATATALSRAARAADEYGDVRVLPMAAADLERGIRPAVARALELSDSLGRTEMIRRIAEELRHPHLFVAATPEGPTTDPVFDEAVGFCDDVARVSPGSAGTMILLETPSRPVAGDSMDLSVGGPADGLLGLLDCPEGELWHSYVHARLAWEIAGDLSRAEAVDAFDFAGLTVGDDHGLEGRLNRFAEQTFSGLGRDAERLSGDFLGRAARGSGGGTAGAPVRFPEQMEAAGLFWRPPGESFPRPAPWWARAALYRDYSEPLHYLLRSCLVCAPVARDVLVRCFDLEAVDRASCTPHPRINGSPELCRRFDEFLRAHPESESRYYPKGCPAAPRGPTDFATYGEILARLPPEPHRNASRHRLRRLRNAVAHGHYVSWATLTEVRRIGASLS